MSTRERGEQVSRGHAYDRGGRGVLLGPDHLHPPTSGVRPNPAIPVRDEALFNDTAMGVLPDELLLHVGSYLERKDRAAISLVCCRLRNIGEDLLYSHIELLSQREETPFSFGNYAWRTRSFSPDEAMWLLYRTLCNQTKLARLVKRFAVHIGVGVDVKTGFSTKDALQRAYPLHGSTGTTIKAENLARSLLRDAMPNLEDLETKSNLPRDFARDTSFTLTTTDIPEPLILRKLKFWKSYGDHFLYTLAAQPALRQLSIGGNTGISFFVRNFQYTPNPLQEFSTSQNTEILIPFTKIQMRHRIFLSFLPSLRKLDIYVDAPDKRFSASKHLVSPWGGTAYAKLDALLVAFEPSCNTLEILKVRFWERGHRMLLGTLLQSCIPVRSLHAFSNLRVLEFPYAALINDQIDHTPSISAAMPPTLESLTVAFPKLNVFTWLEPLTRNKDILPKLSYIELRCHDEFNDNYAMFAFVSQPNKYEQELKSMRGIEINLTYPKGSWKKDWDEYDLSSILLDAWQAALGTDDESDSPPVFTG